MKSLKMLAAGVGATMLATSMLTGFAAAAPKPVINPKMQVVAPKPIMIKPVRPMIARPHVKVRVNRDLLEKKADQDDGEAEALPRSAGQPNGKKSVAAILPPQRLPKPRPDFEDQAGKIADMAGIEGIGEIDPDALRVATNPLDPDGAFSGLLPGADDDEQQPGPSGPTSPFGRPGGNESAWNDPRDGMGSTIPNPAGESSHSKDAPETAPGFSVKTVTVHDADLTGEKPSKGSDTGWQPGPNGSMRRTIITNTSSSNRTEHYMRENPDGTSAYHLVTSYSDGGYVSATTWYDEDGNETASVIESSQGTGVAELRNPDDAGGGGYIPVNCGSVECNESRKGKPGLRLSDGVARALTDPEHSAAGPRTSAEPIVTQHDLLSQYDPEFAGGGEPTPIDKPRIQSD